MSANKNNLCITQHSSTVYDTLAVRQESYTFPRQILHDLESCAVSSGEGRVETFYSMLPYRKVFKLNYATNRQVAGSIPDGIIGIFQ